MSQPAVTITELNGALGVLPSGQDYLAIVGVADSGSIDTPAAYGKSADVVNDFGGGPLVEEAAYAIQTSQRPVIVCRATTAAVGTITAVTQTGTGSSVASVSSPNDEPNNDYEFQFRVTSGGVIGTGPILFRWSLDGGRTESAETDLGTANTFTFPDSGGVTIDFAAGDLDAGDLITFRGLAPTFDGTGIASALQALIDSQLSWEIVSVAGALTTTLTDAIDTAMAADREKMWVGSARFANVGEDNATYQSSLSTSFGSSSYEYGSLWAGGALITSAVSFRKYLSRPSMAVAPVLSTVAPSRDIAEIDLGALTGVALRDANGNLIAGTHDESVNPGLDDLRFGCFRTHKDFEGIYVNNPRIFSASGSDFEFVQHRRVMNLGKRVLRRVFVRRLSKSVVVDPDTGFILEEEALAIESLANSALDARLTGAGQASDASLSLSRTDNILSTKTMTAQAFITPLGYPKDIEINIGFRNPALLVETA